MIGIILFGLMGGLIMMQLVNLTTNWMKRRNKMKEIICPVCRQPQYEEDDFEGIIYCDCCESEIICSNDKKES